MAMVKRAQAQGFVIGSCSDRPISAQRAIWAQHNIAIDFAVGKLMECLSQAELIEDFDEAALAARQQAALKAAGVPDGGVAPARAGRKARRPIDQKPP